MRIRVEHFNVVVFSIIIFLVCFFGIIVSNGIDHKELKVKFKVECEKRGGVMFVLSGVNGWPKPECRNPSSMIDMS